MTCRRHDAFGYCRALYFDDARTRPLDFSNKASGPLCMDLRFDSGDEKQGLAPVGSHMVPVCIP